MLSLLVITNRDAGAGDQESLDAALTVLRTDAEVEVRATGAPDELDDVLATAGKRRIVVAGGDGSLHAVVAALYRLGDLEGRELALLPLGTGNDFARGVGIALDYAAAAETVKDGIPTPIDLLVDDTGGIVVNAAHLGAGASAAREGKRWKKRLGRLAYPVGALKTAWKPPTLHLRVAVDDRLVTDSDEPVLQVALGNGTSVGGGTELTPDAHPGDGRADVMISRATGPLARVLYALRLGFATHRDSEDVEYLLGRVVTVSGDQFWCSTDGEIDGPLTERTWRVEPAAYSVLLPSGGSQGDR